MKGKPLVCIDCETDILKFGQNGVCELTYGKTYYVIETYHIRFYTTDLKWIQYLKESELNHSVAKRREERLKELGI